MRAAGYVGVSTEEQVKHGWNLGADRERIEATITDQGWTLHEIFGAVIMVFALVREAKR